MSGRTTESSLMPHPLTASPALQLSQPTPPHPQTPNNTVDPLDTTVDTSVSATDSFHPRSLLSIRPDPNPAQPPIAPSTESIVPAQNPVVEAAATVPSVPSDHSFAGHKPFAAPSKRPANDRTDAPQTANGAKPLTSTEIDSAQSESDAESCGKPKDGLVQAKPVEDEKDPRGDSTVANVTRSGPEESTLSNDNSVPNDPSALPKRPTDSETLMDKQRDPEAARQEVNTPTAAIDKKRCVESHRFCPSPPVSTAYQISHETNRPRTSASSPDSLMDCGLIRPDFVRVSREKRPLQDSTRPDNAKQQDDEKDNDGSDLKRRKTAPNGEKFVTTDSKSESVEGEVTDDTPQPENDKKASEGDRNDAMECRPVLRTMPAPVGGMLRMLRSSPVALEASGSAAKNVSAGSPASQSSVVKASATVDQLSVDGKGADVERRAGRPPDMENRMDVEPKKKKTVSWAPEEKLVDVQYINNRVDLIRSWDPESEITLPFAPATLQSLKSMSEEQRKAVGSPDGRAPIMDTSGSLDQSQGRKMSAFEAARKKEHDMELERARKAREELQNVLDRMAAVRSWRKPSAIVLPAECRMDADSRERFSLGDEGHRATERSPTAQSPSSPPADLKSSVDDMQANDASVRLFPLSDGSIGISEGNYSAFENSTRSDTRREDDGKEAYYRPQDRNGKYNGDRNGERLDTRHDGDGISSFGISGDRTRTGDGGVPFNNNGTGGFQNRNGQPLPPHAVQHLLSALQSSGLLSQSSSNGQGRDESGEYSRGTGLKANERDNRGDTYRNHHSSSMRNRNGNNAESGSNGVGYVEDDHRHMHVPEGGPIGPGPGVGMSNGGMGPPPPPAMLGHPGQIPPGFQQGAQPGMMEGFPFPMPPIPPPPMGMHPNMLPLGMGMPMPPMGMPLPFGIPPGPVPVNDPNQGMPASKSGRSSSARGREVETITRPKSKGPKQRKKCKYFGTKQGCRDGSSCVFAHN